MASYPTMHERGAAGEAGGGGRRRTGARQLGSASHLELLCLDERALDVRCPPSSCTVKTLRHRVAAEVSRAHCARRRDCGACLGGANACADSAGRPVSCRARRRHHGAGCGAGVLCGHVAARGGCADACGRRPVHPLPTPCPRNPGPHALGGVRWRRLPGIGASRDDGHMRPLRASR